MDEKNSAVLHAEAVHPVQRAFAAVSREIQYNVAIAIKSSTGRTPS
jgi:hypothetical protein